MHYTVTTTDKVTKEVNGISRGFDYFLDPQEVQNVLTTMIKCHTQKDGEFLQGVTHFKLTQRSSFFLFIAQTCKQSIKRANVATHDISKATKFTKQSNSLAEQTRWTCRQCKMKGHRRSYMYLHLQQLFIFVSLSLDM